MSVFSANSNLQGSSLHDGGELGKGDDGLELGDFEGDKVGRFVGSTEGCAVGELLGASVTASSIGGDVG